MMNGDLSIKSQEYTSLNNTKERLLKLYGVDLFAAVSSAALVSPFIAVVDRSIIENMNGKRKLMDGLKYGLKTFATQPLSFMSSAQFRIVLGLYFSTYAAANLVDTTCEQYSVDSTSSSMYKFAATTLVNICLCVYKDKVFARMFGTASTRAFPKLSYFLFTARDSLTIAASFTAPAYIARILQTTELVSAENKAQTVAQLICPATVQFVSTPVHLLALDLYNRTGATLGMRAQLIKKEYFKSTLARIGRIGPAFGFGGVGNTYIRSFRSRI